MRTHGPLWLLWTAACAASSPAAPSASASATHERTPIRFIENDYGRALAVARARRLPLFVDAWAPWCHTCLSMRNFVFSDPSLRPIGESFVWLSLDTEREDNANVVAKLGVRVLPTLYVIEAARETPILAWPGSLTAGELASLLEDSAAAVRRGDQGGTAAASLLRGHRASAEGNFREAIASYREALATAPPDWPRRAQAVDGLVTRLADDQQLAACVDVGADEAPKMPAGTPLADVIRAAVGCAEQLPAGAPERARLGELAALGWRVASDASEPILADDRSDLYDCVVGALRELGRKDDATVIAGQWAEFLERQAAQAPTAAARSVFDAHRVLAYAAVGAPQRALPMLEQSERDFPDDYNPPARMATTYLALKRNDEALAAVKRALARAYGPRKLRLWSLEADVYEAMGDEVSARKSLRAALDFAKTVPLTAGYAKLRDAISTRLTAHRSE
ncbi:MAG TPA: thioredoxin family protein [Polyangiaceae bacterium]|nr:thioredoxin family protein [Polyangiaceae bacterium]